MLWKVGSVGSALLHLLSSSVFFLIFHDKQRIHNNIKRVKKGRNKVHRSCTKRGTKSTKNSSLS